MTLPLDDQKDDRIPGGLAKTIKKSQLFRVTSALSSVGVMKHDIINDLEYVDQLPPDEQNQAFAEFMAGIQSKVEEVKSAGDPEEQEEIYL